MLDESLKIKYARCLFDEPERDAFKAALCLCPDDTGKALWVATNWANDSVVLEEIKRLRYDDSNIEGLASKYDVAKMLLDMAMSGVVDPKDRREALRDFCTLTGIHDFSPNRGNTTNVNVDAAPRVMLVDHHGSTEQWQTDLITQQNALTSGQYETTAKRIN